MRRTVLLPFLLAVTYFATAEFTAPQKSIGPTSEVHAKGSAWSQTSKTRETDAEIKQEIIKQSIASYKGSCPCPYNTDRAGRACGARSAYSKPGGASPLCYAKDVTQKMVDDYRKRTK